jgi:hypothetical protein
MLSDKEIKSFFGKGKQHLDGEDFTKKIISQLDYYPQPQAKKEQPEWTHWIVLISLFLGVTLFVAFGGASFVLKHSIDLFADMPKSAPSSAASAICGISTFFANDMNIVNLLSLIILLSIVAGGIIVINKSQISAFGR